MSIFHVWAPIIKLNYNFKELFLKKTALIRKEYLKLLMEIQDKHRGSSFVENVFKRKSVGIHRKLAEQRSFQTQKN